MPRPLPAPLILFPAQFWPTDADKAAAHLGLRERRDFLEALGHPNLAKAIGAGSTGQSTDLIAILGDYFAGADISPERVPLLGEAIVHRIEYEISSYRIQKIGNPGTTVGSTLATLRELIRAIERAIATGHPRRRAKAKKIMDRIRCCRSSVAAEARERLLSNGNWPGDILAVARDLQARYREHPRIESSVEPFRHFCGKIGMIFGSFSSPGFITPESYNLKRRRFALCVLDAMGETHADYDANPGRLDELLSADVGPCVPTSTPSICPVSGEPCQNPSHPPEMYLR